MRTIFLTALVNELQELSLAESGQLILDIADVDAVAAAAGAVEAIRSRSARVVMNAPPAATPSSCASTQKIPTTGSAPDPGW